MRELSACDFCGDEPSGVYEVVPGDIPGVSARRMVLCADCRDTLADIVDPLLAAGRRSGRSKKPSTDDASSPSGDDSTTESAAASGTDADSEPSHGDTSSPTSDSGSSTGDGADAVDEATGSASASGDATADAAAGEPDDGGDGAAGDAAEASVAGSDAASGGGQQAEQKRIERPPNYGKVVRLVENRDAGIPRADLKTLASSAYDISPSEVEKAIETALTEGRFRETKDGLQTT